MKCATIIPKYWSSSLNPDPRKHGCCGCMYVRINKMYVCVYVFLPEKRPRVPPQDETLHQQTALDSPSSAYIHTYIHPCKSAAKQNNTTKKAMHSHTRVGSMCHEFGTCEVSYCLSVRQSTSNSLNCCGLLVMTDSTPTGRHIHWSASTVCSVEVR